MPNPPAVPCNKKMVVIITGDPKYITDPDIIPLAERFYSEIHQILLVKGFTVEYDPGEPFTWPNRQAWVIIAHDRGLQRLRHAPRYSITIPLETMSSGKSYASEDARRRSPDHYQLSERDKMLLDALNCEE